MRQPASPIVTRQDSSISGSIFYADAGAFAQQVCEPVLGAGFQPDGRGFHAAARFSLIDCSGAVHLRISPGVLTRPGGLSASMGGHFLVIVLHGPAILATGEEKRLLPAKSVIVIDGDLAFSLALSQEDPGGCVVDWLQLGKTRPPALAKAPGYAVMTSLPLAEYIVGQARLVEPAGGDIGPCQRDIPIFDYIAAAIRDYMAQIETEGPAGDRGLYRSIRAFIVQTVKNPSLGADMLAREFGISKRKLYSIFYDNAASLHETIMTARLEAARRELETGRQKVASVIVDYGFSNSSTFYRNYKRRFGTVPRSR